MKNQQNYCDYDGSYPYLLILSLILRILSIMGLIMVATSQESNVTLTLILIAQFISGLLCLIPDVAIYKNKWIENFSTVYVIFVSGLSMGFYTFSASIYYTILSDGGALLVAGAIIIILSTLFRHTINAITIIKMSKIVNKADTYDLYNDDSNDIQKLND